MYHPYVNDWLFGWGWVLWLGFVVLLFSSLGNWGYTYSAHRKYDWPPHKEAIDSLNERYARGEITREQYREIKVEITSPK